MYSCETWGRYIHGAELAYRSGIKTALNVRQNVNNEIVYIESGRWPLSTRIIKYKLKFWNLINNYSAQYPLSALARILKYGLDINIKYLKYYQDLSAKHSDAESSKSTLEKEYLRIYKHKMIAGEGYKQQTRNLHQNKS